MTSRFIVRGSRASQVGFLMRAYRESFTREDGLRGLTQEELLHRMAQVDRDYAERFSHTTVSRWESGRTRPSLQRLEVFGRALDLSEEEVAGLILLAGLAPDPQDALDPESPDATGLAGTAPAVPASVHSNEGCAESRGTGRITPTVRSVLSFGVLRCLPCGLFIAGLGYVLSLIGWDGSWMPVVYLGLVTGVVMVLGLLLPERGAGLRDLLWVSIFFLLTTPALQFAPLGLDHYNFHTIAELAGTPAPHGLTLLVNLAMATAGGLMFQIIGRLSEHRLGGFALRRAVWAVLPPIVLVYGVVVVISNISVSIQLSVLLPVLAFLLTILMVLRDPSVHLSGRERRFLLSAMMAIGLVASTLGIATVLGIYLSPDVPRVLPDHNLLRSWELDFAALGYTREQALDRLNLGYMWHSMGAFVYVSFILGGMLVADIYRASDLGCPRAGPAAVVVEAREEV